MRFSIEAIAALALLSSQQEVSVVSGFTNVIHAGNLHATRNNVGVEVGKSSIRGLRMLGKGWENDDFLNSLGGSDKDREEANDKYNEKKENLRQFRERQAELDSPAARNFMERRMMDSDMIDPMNQMEGSMNDEGFRGPASQSNRFRHMMEQTEQRSQFDDPGQDFGWEFGSSDQRSQSSSTAPVESAPVPEPESRPDFDALAARARGGVVGGGNQLTSDGRPPPPRRRDQIANTSDVYLEQLKADTKARKESFLLGDYEGHQRVWESSKIKELENALNENPFYESERERQKKLMSMLEPSEEDMLVMRKQMEEAEALKASTGLSYKERLAARKKGLSARNTQPASIEPVASPESEVENTGTPSRQTIVGFASENSPPTSNSEQVGAALANDPSIPAPNRKSDNNLPIAQSFQQTPPTPSRDNVNFDHLSQAARDGVYDPSQGKNNREDTEFEGVNFDELANKARGGMMGSGGNQLTSDGRPPPPRRRDQISNTSDVYLEQLKADTKARKQAFLVGDYEGHQKVWETSKIKELENALTENPFYESEQERNKKLMSMFQATEEDLLVMKKQMEEEEALKASSVVSYRDQLARKKQKNNTSNVSSSVQSIEANLVAPSESEMVSSVESPAANVPKTEEYTPKASESEPFVMKAPQAVSVEVSSDKSEDDIRRSLRTLMGLILKHRGGIGFGGGFLKGPDVARYQTTLVEVKEILAKEAGRQVSSVQMEETQEAQMVEESSEAILGSPSKSTDDLPSETYSDLDGSIECIDAIIDMYKNSSPSEKNELIGPLRKALASVMDKSDGISTTEKSTENPESVGEIMSRMEFSQQTSVDATSPITLPSNDERQSHPGSQQDLSVASASSVFEQTYDTLKSITGNGSYGLIEEISPDQAATAIDLLTQMRVALMDELYLNE